MLSISIGGIHSALAGVGDILAPRLTEILPRKQKHADYRIDSHVHGGAIGRAVEFLDERAGSPVRRQILSL